MENQNEERALQLFELGRYEAAIPYFERALAEEPDNFNAKYYIALSFIHLNDMDKTETICNNLLGTHPDSANVFYLKAIISFNKDKIKQAFSEIEHAIRLAPYIASYFGLKASILLAQKKYEDALLATDQGLQIDAKDSLCLNNRAKILTKLNRKEEANSTIQDILQDNPEDEYSHANVGWVALEQGKIQKALLHFKEALTFNPNFEYARQGMATALKSKNPIYALYLKYSFWMAKQSTKYQWIFIIGLYLAYRFLVSVLSANGLSYLAIPLIVLYLIFALGGWIMEALSDTILLFDKHGKYLLDRSQKQSGYVFGLALVSAILFGILYYLLKEPILGVFAITFLCLLLPLPRAFQQEVPNNRIFVFTYAAIMATIGLIGSFFISPLMAGSGVLILLVAYTWLGNFIEDKN